MNRCKLVFICNTLCILQKTEDSFMFCIMVFLYFEIFYVFLSFYIIYFISWYIVCFLSWNILYSVSVSCFFLSWEHQQSKQSSLAWDHWTQRRDRNVWRWKYRSWLESMLLCPQIFYVFYVLGYYMFLCPGILFVLCLWIFYVILVHWRKQAKSWLPIMND